MFCTVKLSAVHTYLLLQIQLKIITENITHTYTHTHTHTHTHTNAQTHFHGIDVAMYQKTYDRVLAKVVVDQQIKLRFYCKTRVELLYTMGELRRTISFQYHAVFLNDKIIPQKRMVDLTLLFIKAMHYQINTL